MILVRSNLPEFSAALREISADLQQKAVAGATRAAATIFLRRARADAPTLQPNGKKKRLDPRRQAGMLKRAMYVSKSKRVRGQGAVRYFVAVRGGSSRRVNRKSGAVTDAFYWRFQEAGWIPRGPGQKLKGGDRSRALARARTASRKVPGKWFIRDAFKGQQQPAIDAFYVRLDAAIRRYNLKK